MLGHAMRPATGAVVKEIMNQHSLKSLFVPPSLVEQLLEEPGGLDDIAKLDWLAYTGGPLSPYAGQAVSKVVDVCQYFGITETLPIQQLIPSRQDWAYVEWNPCRKLELQPSEDEAYELVVFSDHTTRQISGLDHNYPGVKAWHTKDLFKPHPSNSNIWRFHGRKDDIIVLSNGEKFNPVPMEALLQGHPRIAGALVVGQGKAQAALLLESRPDGEGNTVLINDVWPLVEQANRLVPGHGHITRAKIVIASLEKPFQRAGKGTVVRRLTEQSYAPEIEALFGDESHSAHEGISILETLEDLAAVQRYVRSCITSALPGVVPADNDDIFLLGTDSLKAVVIAAMLKTGLQGQTDRFDIALLSDKMLYAHPTVEQLSEEIYRLAHTKGKISIQKNRESLTRVTRMASLVEKYTQNLLPQSISTCSRSISTTTCIALTGSTGALGPHLLQTFLDDPKISHIYCLNRSADARQRHHQISAARGTPTPSDSKATYLRADFSLPTLGLPAPVFDNLKSKVDVIVHNAWKVDFKHSLSSYEGVHIRGTRQLVDWSIASARSPRIMFVSSASAVGNWIIMHKSRGEMPPPIPETIITEYNAAQQMGYGESKHVAERILDAANREAGVPVTILRIGQIAGSTLLNDIAWPQQEWIPSMIKTCASMGKLPGELTDVAWIPVDKLADVISEVIHSDSHTRVADTTRVYNLVNPKAVAWSELIGTIQEHLGLEEPRTAISLPDWIAELEKSDRTDLVVLRDKPALKLLNLFAEIQAGNSELAFDTKNGSQVSQTLRRLEAVGPKWMGLWMKQWGYLIPSKA